MSRDGKAVMRLALLVYKRRYRKHYDVAYFLNGSLRSLLSSCLRARDIRARALRITIFLVKRNICLMCCTLCAICIEKKSHRREMNVVMQYKKTYVGKIILHRRKISYIKLYIFKSTSVITITVLSNQNSRHRLVEILLL